MSIYNTQQAITDLASGLSTTTYPAAALPYIKALKLLFADFESELEQEKAAPTGETVEAAKETIPTSLSDNSGDLSSFHVGQSVHTPDGDGIIVNMNFKPGWPIQVFFANKNDYNAFSESVITPC